jgi:thiamine-monophosphate kinase
VNLSDLAAKGAVPLGYLMTVSTPHTTPDAWFAGFAAGLGQDQREYGIALLGGDTTSTPGPISLSLTAIGHVAAGQAVRRAGAAAGDDIWVTGTIGDGALGLAAARGEIADPTGHLLRYRLPQPRLGLAIAGIASAGMDISDGLVQDLGHICRASGVGAEIDATLVPLSDAARAAGPDRFPTCLTGGDDYELLLAVSPAREAALRQAALAAGMAVTHRVFLRESVRGPDGMPMALQQAGVISDRPARSFTCQATSSGQCRGVSLCQSRRLLMIHHRLLLLLALSVLLPLPASAQINPFRGSRSTPLNADDLTALTDASNRLLDRPHLVAGGTEDWNNPQSGITGTVTAGNPVHRKGLACRALSYRITAPAPQRNAKLTWCKTKDGWKIG